MRRRVHRPAGKRSYGSLWSIIYIDLMTQIMAFFVIVWAIEHGVSALATKASGTGMGIGDQTVRMVDLPGDVLFESGKPDLAADGRTVLDRLFGDPGSGVLNFDQGGLAQRKLVVHGHTDDVGLKDANFELGYQRARAVYQEIRRHSSELPDHVVLCSHADNTPALSLDVAAAGEVAPSGGAATETARAKNRRITIEDMLIAPLSEEGK